MKDAEQKQQLINSAIGAAIQHLVDIEREVEFDRLNRLSQGDKYKLHAATGEAKAMLRKVMDPQQLSRLAQLYAKMYDKLKAQASKYDPVEWTYATAVRRVLDDVIFEPYRYNQD